MNKISILEQFAADAIGAPAVVTGGCAPCKVTKVKTVKCKANTKAKGSSKVKVKSGSGKSGGSTCDPKPPVIWK